MVTKLEKGENTVNIEKIYFQATDGLELDGLLHKGEKKSSSVILSVHGMTSNCLKKREDVIAREAIENGIDYFSFNNRGHDIQSYASQKVGGTHQKKIIGMANEDVLDSVYDIKGAILILQENGYTDFYLQGHSLGCTKVVYTYHQLKEAKDPLVNSIKAVILLSLIDIPRMQQIYLGKHYQPMMQIAEENEKKEKLDQLMPKEAFIHPISTKTYLRYFRDNQAINFAQYHNKEYDFPELSQIQVPLFMRWGNLYEMIEQKAEDLVQLIQEKVHNPFQDIAYIEGADHGYSQHKEQLAKEIVCFLKKIQ